jgi:hypothetical protein
LHWETSCAQLRELSARGYSARLALCETRENGSLQLSPDTDRRDVLRCATSDAHRCLEQLGC